MRINIIIDSDHCLENKEIARELLDKAVASIAMSDLDVVDAEHFKHEIRAIIKELDEIIAQNEAERTKRAESNKVKSEWTIMDW